MRVKALFRRLRAFLRREKVQGSAEKALCKPVQLASAQPAAQPAPDGEGEDGDGDGDGGAKTITLDWLEQSADQQAASAFFAQLPLEIRRIIYRHTWRGYLKQRRVSPSSPGSDLRLHIYSDGSVRSSLGHTRCRVHPGAPAQEDPWVTAPWPWPVDARLAAPDRMPPRWFWAAWVMRLNWGRHWKCQHAIQKRWDPATGEAQRAEKAPFLPVWLTCKKMYLEAAQSFFESVTLVFTSSVDANHFFTHYHRHLFLANLRFLELSFSNPNDHLYLSPVSPVAAAGETTDDDTTTPPSTAASSNGGSGGSQQQQQQQQQRQSPGRPAHACIAVLCHSTIFGAQLWDDVLRAVRAACPRLRDLDVTIGGRIARARVLGRFGRCEDEGEEQDEDGPWEGGLADGSGEAREAEKPGRADEGAGLNLMGEGGGDQGVWKLPGKVSVRFKFGNARFVQEGGRMVRLVEELE